MPIVEESEFQSFLENKKVILVGPASSMENSELGEFIDSHDVVVRINRGFLFTNPPDSKDFGTRTDILYHCLSSQYVGQKSPYTGDVNPDPNMIIANKVKIVSGAYPAGEFMYSASIIHNIKHLLNYDQINLRRLPSEPYFSVKNHLDCHMTSGFSALNDLLRSDLKTLNIVGLEFYRDKETNPHYKQYMAGKDWKWHYDVFTKGHVHSHHPDREFCFFKYEIYKKDPRVLVGEKLKHFLSDKKYERLFDG